MDAHQLRDEIRTRILDAATNVLLETNVSDRLHAQIAQAAGVSRPTVYKYVGDQGAILDAVFEREYERFLASVMPRLRIGDDVRADVIDGVTLIVDYARKHTLLQKALRDEPAFVLPALTSQADALLEQTLDVFAAPMAEILGDRTRGRLAAEWLFRLIVSLIVMPGHSGRTRADVRRHLETLADLLS